MKLLLPLVILSLSASASVRGRWVHSDCYQMSGGAYYRHELLILKEQTWLRKNVHAYRDCSDRPKTVEMLVDVKVEEEKILMEGLEYQLRSGPLDPTTLVGPFTSFTLVDQPDTDALPRYSQSCPDFTGEYELINDENHPRRKIEQRGCEVLRIQDSRGYVTYNWGKKEVIVADHLPWNIMMSPRPVGTSLSYFEGSSLIREMKFNIFDDGPVVEKHFLSTKPCTLPPDGKIYYVVERHHPDQATNDHCFAFKRVNPER